MIPINLHKLLSQYVSAKKSLNYLKKNIPLGFSESFSPQVDKKLLIVSMGWYDVKTESLYAKAIETLGYKVYIVTRWDPFVAKMLKVFGLSNVSFYHKYSKGIKISKIEAEAKSIIKNSTAEGILEFEKKSIKIGRYAASSFMRFTRKSSFEHNNLKTINIFLKYLIDSLKSVSMAENIISDIKPNLLLVNDRAYTPVGHIFDFALTKGIPSIQRAGSHRSGSEILKKYDDPSKSKIHYFSLSKETWDFLKKIPRNEKIKENVQGELKSTYVSGDWFSEVGTQFNKKLYTPQELADKLVVDKGKKVAVVFAHMFWDATFFGGNNIFKDYYDWFINLLKAANENKNINWVIKLHPANSVKAKRDNYKGKHKELAAIFDILGKIPDHIKIIPSGSDINTFSLFPFMDYCLTVRGTIGIEASCMGVTTLTAGEGRYDKLGFTYDFNSQHKYLETLKRLENLPKISSEQVELACRYAYGVFILRPIKFDIVDRSYLVDDRATMNFKFLFENRNEFENSLFVRKLREFILSGKEDFLNRGD